MPKTQTFEVSSQQNSPTSNRMRMFALKNTGSISCTIKNSLKKIDEEEPSMFITNDS